MAVIQNVIIILKLNKCISTFILYITNLSRLNLLLNLFYGMMMHSFIKIVVIKNKINIIYELMNSYTNGKFKYLILCYRQ